MTDRIIHTVNHGQVVLTSVKGTEEKGQQVLPTDNGPRAGQDADKLVLPEMPLPPELPADGE